mgnify:CR=1 FL=1|tara:strand:+ start:24382 stop:24921 length:540 start_codon:yes stop_codon:yes gene_type:complete
MSVDGLINWYSPEHRGIIPLEDFHVPKRLSRLLRQRKFRATINQDFIGVISACASRKNDSGNWIDENLITSYLALHSVGHAHSIEVWSADQLVGGLYGVSLKGAFFGESMFHLTSNASKIALVVLIERLKERGYRLLDVQWLTPHLAGFGGVEIERNDYLNQLDNAMRFECHFDKTNIS